MAEEVKVKTEGTVMVKKKKKIKARNNTIKKLEAWTITQKKKLMSLLYEYPLDAYRNIASKIKGKDEEQVKDFICKIRRQLKSDQRWKSIKKKDAMRKAPLDGWLDVATDMVELENIDNSTNLSKVLTVVSNFEDFEMPPPKEDASSPNYMSIYKYLSQVLQVDRGDDMEILGPIESAIVIDMLHGLMEVLSEYDTTVQRSIMKWKYQLLEARDKHGQAIPELQKRASENDYTEFIEEAKMSRYKDQEYQKRYVAKMNQKEQGKKSTVEKGKRSVEKTTPSVSGTTSDQTSASVKGQYSGITLSSAETSTISSSQSAQEASTSCKSLSKSTTITESESDAGVDLETEEESKSVIKRHKPGRKGSRDPPETPYTEIVLVMPPKGVEIKNYNPRTKKGAKERLDGKYQPLDPDEELVTNDLSREITYNVHRTKSDQTTETTTKRKQTVNEVHVKEDVDNRYDSLSKPVEDRDNNIPVKKPKLYSINPFCVPVTLLDFKASNLSKNM